MVRVSGVRKCTERWAVLWWRGREDILCDVQQYLEHCRPGTRGEPCPCAAIAKKRTRNKAPPRRRKPKSRNAVRRLSCNDFWFSRPKPTNLPPASLVCLNPAPDCRREGTVTTRTGLGVSTALRSALTRVRSAVRRTRGHRPRGRRCPLLPTRCTGWRRNPKAGTSGG